MAGLTEFYCGRNELSHASQFKWLEYTFKPLFRRIHGYALKPMRIKIQGFDDNIKKKLQLKNKSEMNIFLIKIAI